MTLNYVTLTETFKDGAQDTPSGYVKFTPSQSVYAAGQTLVSVENPITVPVTNGVLGSVELLATDNTGLTFTTLTGFFFWSAEIVIGGVTQPGFSFALPSSPATRELFSLANTGTGSGGGAVSSVFSRTGAVVAQSGDYTASQVGAVPVSGGAMTGALAPAVVGLTDAASIAVNAAAGNNFRVTLGGNRTLSSPTGGVDGQNIVFVIAQDATGSRLLNYGGAYAFGTAGQPTLSASPGDVDILGFTYDATLSQWLFTGAVTGFTGPTGWTLIGSNAVAFSDGGSGHVYTLPSGAPVTGQIDVLCVSSNGTVTTPASSGAAWQANPTHIANQGTYIFWRIATGGEGATVTLTTSANTPSQVSWSRWQSATPPIVADTATNAAVNGANGTTTPAVSTGTLAATGELVIAFAALHGVSASLTGPAWSTGYVPLTSVQSGTTANDVVGFTAYKTQAGTPAESPSVSWTNNAFDRYILVLTLEL